jgi:hypothetical protein
MFLATNSREFVAKSINIAEAGKLRFFKPH